MVDEERGTTRRTVLRTAANAAWSVPVIAVATAAPASAVGSPVGTIELVGPTGAANTSPIENENSLLGVPTTVQNFTGAVRNTSVNSADTVSSITVTINFPLIDVGLAFTLSGSGWSGGTLLILPGGALTLTWTGTLAAGTSTPAFVLVPVLSLNVLAGPSATATGVDAFGHNLSNSDTFTQVVH